MGPLAAGMYRAPGDGQGSGSLWMCSLVQTSRSIAIPLKDGKRQVLAADASGSPSETI